MARDDDDDAVSRAKRPQAKNLDPMSIEELRDYVADMKAEIARVEEKIKAKHTHASAAEHLFKR